MERIAQLEAQIAAREQNIPIYVIITGIEGAGKGDVDDVSGGIGNGQKKSVFIGGSTAFKHIHKLPCVYWDFPPEKEHVTCLGHSCKYYLRIYM